MTVKATTPGNWIVAICDDDKIKLVAVNEDGTITKTIATIEGEIGDESEGEALANAAILSISKDMLNALIAIQQTLMSDKEVINLEDINQMISGVFAKLANEAGEEL